MRESDLLARITTDPEQCGGRPCIRGTRLRVIDVLELLAAGEISEEILAEYPYPDREVHTLVWPNGADFDPSILHDWPQRQASLERLVKKWEQDAA